MSYNRIRIAYIEMNICNDGEMGCVQKMEKPQKNESIT